MPEHALQPHVLRLARRLDLARVVVVQHAAGQSRHGDRRVPALADVDDVDVLVRTGRGVAAVGDEQLRQRRHVARQQRRNDRADDNRQRPGPGRASASAPAVDAAARARSSAARPQMMMSACCECCVPSQVDHDQAAAEGADDRAQRCWRRRRRRRADPGPGPSRATEASASGKLAPHRIDAGSTTQKRAGEVELKVVPGARRDRRVDRPERQRERQRVGGPADRAAQQHLHPAEGDARPLEAARQHRADAAADADAEEEDGEDEREGVDRRAEEQRERARPDDLRRQRRRRRKSRSRRRPTRRRRRPGPWPSALPVLRTASRARRASPSSADDQVERDGDVGGDGHVVHAQQVEAGEQAADDRAAGVAAVEVAEPGHALRAGLDPARHRRQRRAHQDRRRQQADAGGQGAEDQAADAGPAPGDVDAREHRHAEENQQAENADADLHARRRRAADARATTRSAGSRKLPRHMPPMNVPSSTRERNRRRADDELQQLEPDDFVDEGGAAAARQTAAAARACSGAGSSTHLFNVVGYPARVGRCAHRCRTGKA